MKICKTLSAKNSDYATHGHVTALFLGDSITHGAFEIFTGRNSTIDQIYDHDAVYHAQLKKMLANVFPNAPLNTINAGISGGNAAQALKRLDRDVFPYTPDLVVVCFGLNDSFGGISEAGSYAAVLGEILRTIRNRGIEIVFMTPNIMNTYVSPLIKDDLFLDIAEKAAQIQNNGIMDEYMAAAGHICNKEGIAVCDCYGKWKKLYEAGVDTTSLLANHINHPNREMHKLFAQSLFEQIMFD